MAKPSLVLFDIDGTIMSSGLAGKSAFSVSLKEVFNIEDDLSYITWAGATDLGVLEQVANHNQTTLAEELQPHFFEALSKATEKNLVGSEQLIVFPGIRHLIEELNKDASIELGLVTGNGQGSAYAKIHAAGVGQYFNFGGFGDEHKDRNILAEKALARGTSIIGNTPQKVLLIGDTPSDIQAAHHIGALSIAVATGQHSLQELDEYEPAIALNDLSSPEMISLLLN